MNEVRTKKLQEKVKKNGFEYRLVKRTDEKAIYSQHTPLGDLIAYEVFKTRLSKPHPKSVEDLKNFDLVEIFPSDEEFGTRAWTYSNLGQAEKAFASK